MDVRSLVFVMTSSPDPLCRTPIVGRMGSRADEMNDDWSELHSLWVSGASS